MELELPLEIVCPQCRSETVELKENRRENPYYHCGLFDSNHNLRPREREEAYELLQALSESEPYSTALESVDPGETEETTELDEPSDEGNDDPLSDILSGDSEETQ